MKSKLKDNLAVKILSVCIAVILWFYIQMVQNPEIEFTFNNMKISLVNSSLLQERNLVVIDEKDFKADITVNCPRWSLNELSEDDFVAYVDLSEIKSAGTIELPVKVRINNENIIATNKSPSTIKIDIDNIVTVEKELKLHVTGKVKDDYYTDENLISLSTQSISVKGPKSVVSRVENGIVSVDISNKSESFSDGYKVVLTDKEGTAVADERITVLNGDVAVDVSVLATKVLPVEIPGIPEDIKYTITPASVEIAGPEDIIEQMDNITVNDFVLHGHNEGYTQNVEITLGNDLIMLSDVIPQIKISPKN